MISKRFLLVLICSVVLLGAVAAYAYIQVSNNKNHTEIKTRTFNFEWVPFAQNVTLERTLLMNLTFTLEKDGNLSIVAKISDDDPNGGDYLGIAYKGHATLGSLFYSSNLTKPMAFITTDGIMDSPILGIFPSDFHTCVYEPGVGYTFFISLPPSEGCEGDGMLHICFYDNNVNGGVYVRFYVDIVSQWSKQ